ESIEQAEIQTNTHADSGVVLASEKIEPHIANYSGQSLSTKQGTGNSRNAYKNSEFVQNNHQVSGIKNRQEEAIAELHTPLHKLDHSGPKQVESIRPVDHFPASRLNVSPSQDLA